VIGDAIMKLVGLIMGRSCTDIGFRYVGKPPLLLNMQPYYDEFPMPIRQLSPGRGVIENTITSGKFTIDG
jgi:hypothetical protein